MKEYAVIYEQGPTSWGAHVPDLPICFAVGDTYEEVDRLIREGIELHVKALQEDGDPVPEPVTRVAMVPVPEVMAPAA